MTIAQISLSALAPSRKALDEEVRVGKDVLDLLTGAMYVDPLTIYREYIQNAADSVDDARAKGLNFPAGPNVTIYVDHQERCVRIRDFGAGIPAANFSRKLTTIGASEKRGKGQRGFRGVGRLSGLGYCQELVFRGRTDGETKVSEVRWDGRILREKMRDTAFKGGLSEIVAAAVTQVKIPGDGYPDRFFEVELRRVQRARNDVLLNEDAIRSYLSQVAPLPFAPDFSHGPMVQAHLDRAGPLHTICLKLDGDPEPVYHRACDQFPLSDKQLESIQEIQLLELRDSDGALMATGWIGHHAYVGSVPKKLGLGGIRLRCGNIQVGDDNILSALYPEPRFASWPIGDVHVVSSKIQPNARRDDFEFSVAYADLKSDLAIIAKSISQRIRRSSGDRNAWKSVHSQLNAVEVWSGYAAQRPLNIVLRRAITDVATERLSSIVRGVTKLPSNTDESVALAQRLAAAVEATQAATQSIKRAEARKPVQTNQALNAALKTILSSSAARPDQGVKLASDVLTAVETTWKRSPPKSLPKHK